MTRDTLRSGLRRAFAVMLAFLMAASVNVSAFAAETDVTFVGDENGFSIGELPAFGEDDELIFPEEDPIKDTSPEETESPEKSTPPEASVAPEETQSGITEEAGDTEKSASPSAPEETPKINYLPVIIIAAAVLVIGVVVTLLSKQKRRSARHLDSRRNGRGGRK